jgi:hypothetical protein
MKSMLWKELRENWKWAVLGFLFLVAAEFYSLSAQRHAQDYEDPTLCGSGFLLISAFGCAAVGAGLAVLQILPDLRRDQWAALLHRPVSRSVLFLGKILAGLLLYSCATTLPFLLSTVFVATPGQFAAPLVPGMLRPGLSDIAFGPVLYFGAMLLCLHRGRWFGTRGAIGLAIVPMFFLHVTVGWPFLLPLLCSLILLAAAWGAMLGNGRVDTHPRAGWIAYVLAVLVGLETALLLSLLLIAAALQLLPSGRVEPLLSYTRFVITQDGRILIATQRLDGTAQVLTDTQGNVVTDARYTGNTGYQEFCELLPLSWQLGKGSSPADNYIAGQPRNASNFVQELTRNQGQEAWYRLMRQNYLIGYNKLSRRRVGIFDADGFKAAGAKPRPFPLPLNTAIFFAWEPQLIWSGSQLYAVRFPERNVVRINAPGEMIYGAARLGSFLQDQPVNMAVALAKEVRIFDAQGAPVCSIPYQHQPDIWSAISVATNSAADRFYLQSEPGFPWAKTPKTGHANEPLFLDEADRQGKVLHTYSIPNPRIVPASPSWVIQAYPFVSPIPAFAASILSHGGSFPYDASNMGLRDLSAGLHGIYLRARDVTMLAVAGAWAIFTWFWGRRRGLSAKGAGLWSAFVFCFGLPGLLTFRLTAHWPPRIPCLQCGRQRPIDTEQCPYCHQAWQSAPATGTEIFDLSR